MLLKNFTNDKYNLIEYLKSKEKKYNNKKIIKTSQEEISNNLNMSKHKVNCLIKELIEIKALELYDLKGKYIITPLGNQIIDYINNFQSLNKASKFKCASFFSGVGGIDLGFEKVGFETVYANELDIKATHTYHKNFLNVNVDCRDIQNVVKDLENGIDVFQGNKFDVLLAGFPCQAFSIAGYREGFEDKKGRGGLFFEIMKIIRIKKPKIVFLENVKNLVTHDNGKTFKIIKEALISEGYHIKYQVMNSCKYGNLPQNRERIYIIAFKDKAKCDEFTFPDTIPLVKTLEKIIDYNKKVDDKFYYTSKFKHFNELKKNIIKSDTLYQWRRVYVRENKNNLSPTLTANMGTGGHNVPLALTKYGIRKLTPKECFLLQGFPSNFVLPDDIAISYLYKQAGNSVSVSVIERIAQQILSIL